MGTRGVRGGGIFPSRAEEWVMVTELKIFFLFLVILFGVLAFVVSFKE